MTKLRKKITQYRKDILLAYKKETKQKITKEMEIEILKNIRTKNLELLIKYKQDFTNRRLRASTICRRPENVEVLLKHNHKLNRTLLQEMNPANTDLLLQYKQDINDERISFFTKYVVIENLKICLENKLDITDKDINSLIRYSNKKNIKILIENNYDLKDKDIKGIAVYFQPEILKLLIENNKDLTNQEIINNRYDLSVTFIKKYLNKLK